MRGEGRGARGEGRVKSQWYEISGQWQLQHLCVSEEGVAEAAVLLLLVNLG